MTRKLRKQVLCQKNVWAAHWLKKTQQESTSETSCFPNDIANYFNVGSLTDEQKYYVLCNVWVPSTLLSLCRCFSIIHKVTFFLNAVVLLFQYYPRLNISRTIVMVLSEDDLRVKLLPC